MKIRLFRFLLALALLYPVSLYADTSQDTSDTEDTAILPLDELRNFVQAFEQIRRAYVEEIDDKTLLENAIKGLLTHLDPHSTYLNEENFADLQEHSTGKFGGLGIEVALEDGLIRVVTPIDDSPADKAGIRAGDLISEIDDQLVNGMSLSDAVDLMRGEKGSKVRLTLLREGLNKPLEVTITRDIIETKSVRWEYLEDGYGYVRIAQFQENTGQQFRAAIEDLNSQENLAGLVLDLRNNPGGVLNASLEVTDALLDKGLIVYTEGRTKESASRFHAGPATVLQHVPLVVLINGGSASASEIVAGALQDNHRALIAGTRSFGKGSVQTVLPLDESRAIKLTTARYYTPSGRSIQAQGIEPDIEIKPAKIEELDESYRIQEKNLAGHLENDKARKTKETTHSEKLEDNQIQGALNLLKGIVLFNQQGTVEPPKTTSPQVKK